MLPSRLNNKVHQHRTDMQVNKTAAKRGNRNATSTRLKTNFAAATPYIFEPEIELVAQDYEEAGSYLDGEGAQSIKLDEAD